MHTHTQGMIFRALAFIPPKKHETLQLIVAYGKNRFSCCMHACVCIMRSKRCRREYLFIMLSADKRAPRKIRKMNSQSKVQYRSTRLCVFFLSTRICVCTENRGKYLYKYIRERIMERLYRAKIKALLFMNIKYQKNERMQNKNDSNIKSCTC